MNGSVHAYVDYLTVTAAHGLEQVGNLEAIYDGIRFSEATAGCDEVETRVLGYRGRQVDTAFYGSNQHGVMLRVSSGLADLAFDTLLLMGANYHVTRLDIQHTSGSEHDTFDLAARQSTAVREAQGRTKTAQPPQVRLLQTYGRGDTLTIGSRSSQIFVRIYDKSREQKIDGPPWYWRYEVELKQERAVQAMQFIHAAYERNYGKLEVLMHYLTLRHVDLPEGMRSHTLPFELARPERTVDKKLKWLREHVRSSISYLQQKGFEYEAMQALGIDTID